MLAMAVISLKLPFALDAQLTAFLQSSEQGMEGTEPQSAADLMVDLVGSCKGEPADLSSNPAYLSEFGTI